MSLDWVDEYHSTLPASWFPTLLQLGMAELLTGKGESYVETAQQYMRHSIAVGDREGVQKAQSLLELAIKARFPEQIAANEAELGLLPPGETLQGCLRGCHAY